MRYSSFVSIAVLAAALGSAAHAQSPRDTVPATLVGHRAVLTGYFAFDARFTSVKGKFGVLAGAEGALLVNHRLSVGLGGWGLATDNAQVNMGVAGPQRLTMGYGGLQLGWVARPGSVLHPTVGVLVAGGEIEVGDEDEDGASDHVFVLEPSLGLELSVSRALRLVVGATYRHVADVEVPGVRASDVRGFAGQVVLRVGRF